MKPLIAIIITLTLAGCASFEGNGVSASVQYTDPATGVIIDIQTAK